jgi:hypothetical protein
MVSAVNDKNPVSFGLFTYACYHAHMIPLLLAEMTRVGRKLKPKQTVYALRRFGDVYGAEGIHRLAQMGLVSETEKATVLESLMDGQQSKEHLRMALEESERRGVEPSVSLAEFDVRLCNCVPLIGLEDALGV